MRNVFDQYFQTENRVTHALVTALHEDPWLLRAFLRGIAGRWPQKSDGQIAICEQVYPGASQATETAENDEKRKGIPDAWITTGNNWCLIIENKIQSAVDANQLDRHLRTAKSRGYPDPRALLITIKLPKMRLPEAVRVVEWTSIYCWAAKHARRSRWAARLAEFLEVTEARMVESEKMPSGTLTVFSGFPFGSDHTYDYPDAKRILGLAMDELRKRRDLKADLRIDPEAPGRGAIKGKGWDIAWDILQLRDAKPDANFTRFPHLDLGIGQRQVDALLTIPDKVPSAIRQRLIDLQLSGFKALVGDIEGRMRPLIRRCPGMQPRLRIHQRHWASRAGPATYDAMIDVDLRTGTNGNGLTKYQPEWIDAVYEGLAGRRSNLELQIGAVFPYRTCPKLRSVASLDLIAGAWTACKPLVDILAR